MFVFLTFVCSQREVLRRADHSPRGVLPSVVCPVSVIAKPRKGSPGPGIGSKRQRKEKCQEMLDFGDV